MMPSKPPQDPPDEPGEAVSQLNEGLECCHKVVSRYRAALLKKSDPETNTPKDD